MLPGGKITCHVFIIVFVVILKLKLRFIGDMTVGLSSAVMTTGSSHDACNVKVFMCSVCNVCALAEVAVRLQCVFTR